MRRYVFADEAGCFAFLKNNRASKYFIICTASFDSCAVGEKLLRLRRELIWEGAPLGPYFHACEDKQTVRDRVFSVLASEDFTVQATILEKSKAQPQTRTSDDKFYQYAWNFHLMGVRTKILSGAKEVLVTAATIGQKRTQSAFSAVVKTVLTYHYPSRIDWKNSHCPAMADPCIQAADYCTWAIQRKWERGDARSYDLIKDKINHEYESWKHGTRHYY